MVIDEYIGIIRRFGIGRVLALRMYGGSYIAGYQKGDTEKVSPYECGFNPFEDAREKFQVKFYLVRILFLIFDLEVIYLFPWAVGLNNEVILKNVMDVCVSDWRVMRFLRVLTIGFIYEWKKGALDQPMTGKR